MGFFDFFRRAEGPPSHPPHPGPGPRFPNLKSRKSRGSLAGLGDRLNTLPQHAIEFLDGEYTTVTSSWHMAAQYIADAELLTINFVKGGGMKVSNVSINEALGYITAKSHGEYTWDAFLGRGWKRGSATKKPITWFK